MISTSGVEEVDFGQGDETAKLINNFVSNSTNGLIEKIVTPSSFNGETKLMLVNAIYFFGKWQMPFEKEETKPMLFEVEKHNQILTEGMNIVDNFHQFKMKTQNGEIGILEMPYKDEDFAMYLILPPEEIDIRDFNWTEINFKELDAKMKSKKTALNLPKFRIEYEKNLLDLFQKLDANDAFSPKGTRQITMLHNLIS